MAVLISVVPLAMELVEEATTPLIEESAPTVLAEDLPIPGHLMMMAASAEVMASGKVTSTPITA